MHAQNKIYCDAAGVPVIPGARVLLADGNLATISGRMMDGAWLVCFPGLDETPQMRFHEEIVEVLS